MAAAASLLVAAPAAAQFAPGATGVGDPFFPHAGNGGYDVINYDLRLAFDPDSDRLRARARIDAVATQPLSRFSLDYRGPRVASVRLAGRRARFARIGPELLVTPSAGIAAGSRFTVAVRYAGRPHPIRDPDGSREGWFHTDDGSLVAAQPQGASTWFPANDHPTDKAAFAFRITVPRGLEAVANGRLLEVRANGRRAIYRWREDDPMAPYLATVATGRFRLEHSREAGLRSVVAVDPRLWRGSRRALAETERILRLLESLLGPYPFDDVGAVVDRVGTGYALEVQTRPFYDGPPDGPLIAHELAHQWLGNSVTLMSWPEIWLNEGLATWVEWRWHEASGGVTTARRFADLYATPATRKRFWNPPPAALSGPEQLFGEPVYIRGAMAVELLRQRVGDATFVAILRDWTRRHEGANASIADFVELVEAHAGDPDLSETLFEPWLYTPGKPPA